MEKILCWNGHVGVGGPGRPGGRRAGEASDPELLVLHVRDPNSSHDAAGSRKGHLCTSPR
jgi:hypothetical protein